MTREKYPICRGCAVNKSPLSNDSKQREHAFSSSVYWLDKCGFCDRDNVECTDPIDWAIHALEIDV